MNILVCVKQVPDTTEIKIDPVKNTLIRKGVPSIVNTFDKYALEAAARIKDSHPEAKISVLTMGPPQATAALRECMEIAADDAYLATDRVFGGSDTFATSYILSEVVKKIEADTGAKFDMIFCGKQAIDGDTAQVGPEMAEHLGWPQVTCGLACELAGDTLKVSKQREDGIAVIGVQLPCVVTFSKPTFAVRPPTIRRKLAAKHAEIRQVVADDLESLDRAHTGLKGSPTKVRRTRTAEVKTNAEMIDEGSAQANAQKLADMLSAAGAF
ncbi:electron transfer flavoprotein subunit beta/FixA family protein [Curtanaerobium respiraculi]|uniref:electron transfer flavoprotein subunit beta/FixA family protein n=1 Tax=Curtanaerobium respiraculi TaxID=2949669 RepID=UPI0024B3B1C5|nr:electron transfer flavoprotein subunit beta/FixA family protein [Curtanaerobium respiraculi]